VLKTTVILLIFILALAFSCSNSEKKVDNAKEQKLANISNNETYEEGLEIFSTNCVNCHSPRGTGKNQRVAPPIKAIKRHYLDAETSEEEFVSNLTNFLMNPKEENSRMPGALEKFGLMPNLGMTKEQYEAVAKYIYSSQVEDPDWYATVYKEEKAKLAKKTKGNINYLKEGGKLAFNSLDILSLITIALSLQNSNACSVPFDFIAPIRFLPSTDLVAIANFPPSFK
jgi:mono/diheme cytochrome c family protein